MIERLYVGHMFPEQTFFVKDFEIFIDNSRFSIKNLKIRCHTFEAGCIS